MEKTSDTGTAITVGSQQHQQLLQQVSQYAGGSPEKRQGSWRRRWVEVHQLEDELRRSDVVKAFHLRNDEIMQLLKAPSIKSFNHRIKQKTMKNRSVKATNMKNKNIMTNNREGRALSTTRYEEVKIDNNEELDSSLATTHRLISRKLSTTSLAGVYLTQDNVKILPPPPPPPVAAAPSSSSSPFRSTANLQQMQSLNNSSSNILMQSVASTIAIESEKDRELQNILSVVKSKIEHCNRPWEIPMSRIMILQQMIEESR